MLGSQRSRQRQIWADLPLVLTVQSQAVKIYPVPGHLGVCLIQGCEVLDRIRRCYSPVIKGVYGLRQDLSCPVEVEAKLCDVRAQKADACPQLVLCDGLHCVIGYL